MVSVDPSGEVGKELLSHLKLLSAHYKVVGPFQAIAGWQNAQLPTSSSVYKLEITSLWVPSLLISQSTWKTVQTCLRQNCYWTEQSIALG